MASSFTPKENPNMEKALFDWPIVLQYDVKDKYRLISAKFFSPGRSLNQPKATRVCICLINQSNRSISVRCCFCFVYAFSFQGHTKIPLWWSNQLEALAFYVRYFGASTLFAIALTEGNDKPT